MSFCKNGVVQVTAEGLKKPNGLILTYPNLVNGKNKESGKNEYTYAQRNGRDKVYGAKVFQRCTQSLARDIMAEIILEISKKYHVVGTVHDEVLLLVKEDCAEQALKELLTLMRTPPEWAPDLPLDGEGGVADSYGDAK
jgi:DNA polymerase